MGTLRKDNEKQDAQLATLKTERGVALAWGVLESEENEISIYGARQTRF